MLSPYTGVRVLRVHVLRDRCAHGQRHVDISTSQTRLLEQRFDLADPLAERNLLAYLLRHEVREEGGVDPLA